MELPQFLQPVWNVHYLKALAIAVGAYVVMQILLFISEKVFLHLAKKTKTQVDDEVVSHTRKPLAFLILIIGIRMAAEVLEFSEAINLNIERAISTLLTLIIAHIVVKVVNILMDQVVRKMVARTKSALDDDLIGIIHKFVRIATYALALIYVLNIWGIKVGPLLASLGIAGIAVAFALQNTLGNIFGGVSLLLDKTIRIGDIIQLEDGTLGKVEKMSLRSTKIRTFDNELMSLPNGKFADSKITNWNLPDRKVRINVKFGVEYGSGIEKVKKLVMDILKKDKDILPEPEPQVIFLEMADFSLNFVTRFWIPDIDEKIVMKERITTEIYNALNKAKIGIPFPTRTVYLKE